MLNIQKTVTLMRETPDVDDTGHPVSDPKAPPPAYSTRLRCVVTVRVQGETARQAETLPAGATMRDAIAALAKLEAAATAAVKTSLQKTAAVAAEL